MPRDSSGFRNQLADIAAVRIENLVFAHEHILQLQAVGLPKGLLENRAGNLESNEVVVAVRGVAFPRDFKNVKTKFGFHMGQPAVLKRNAVPVSLPEAGIQNRNGAVGAKPMTVVVRGVMRERTDGEGVFVDILSVSQKRVDEVAVADIMREAAEKGAAVRVVAHILNDGAAVGVGLGPAQILLGCLRKFLLKERFDVRFPSRIDDGFVREDGVGVNGSRQRQQNGDQANDYQTNATKQSIHDSSWRRKRSFRLHVSRIKQDGPSWLEERLGKANRNTKIRTAKTSDDREGHANHFSVAIDERPTRAAGSGLCIVDNFVRKNVADMTLCNQRADKFTAEKFIDNFFWFSARGLGDFVHGIFTRARKNGTDARGVAEREQRLATDRRLLAGIHFQDGLFQTGQITFQHSEVRLLGNLGNADGNAGGRVGEIGGQIRHSGMEPLASDGT